MKNTKFLELMGGIDEELLEKAGVPKKKKRQRKIWISAIAACLALCISVGAILSSLGGKPVGIGEKDGFNIAKAIYPEEDIDMAPFYEYYESHGGITSFYKAIFAEMIKTEAGENTVYSPANLYMELAMLAEMTGGESRAQILALLGEDDIESVRKTANALWMLSYNCGGNSTTLIANSVWFREDYDPYLNGETMKTLASVYHVSTYSGRFTDQAYVQAMKDWTNEHTKGFLEGLEMDWNITKDTAISLISTIYFKDGWETAFEGSKRMRFFPTDESDGIVCDFLSIDNDEMTAYSGSNFIALRKPYGAGSSMLFVLPGRGYSTDDLIADGEFLEFIASPDDWEHKSEGEHDVRIPKFDISEENDIIEKIKNLGVTDIFIPGVADFTPIVAGKIPWVYEINHGVRIKIDEDGCEGAGYTQSGAVDIDTPMPIPRLIKFDRPFIFSVLTESGVPLFTGIINDPSIS